MKTKYQTTDEEEHTPSRVSESLGLPPKLPTPLPGRVSYRISMVKDGLPLWDFELLKNRLGVTEDRLGELLGMSRATLHRRKKTGRLDTAESDRLARFGRLADQAADAFGGEDGGRSWLKAPAIAFQGASPLDYADTEIGAREVEALIGRLEQGVFS